MCMTNTEPLYVLTEGAMRRVNRMNSGEHQPFYQDT